MALLRRHPRVYGAQGQRMMPPDYMPPEVAIPAGLIVTAYVLLSEKQRWGRFLISELKRLRGEGHA